MGTATRKAQRTAAKLQTLSFKTEDRGAARKEVLRMTTNAQWKNRNPVPGRGPKSFHKPEQAMTQSVFGNRQSPAVKSI